MRPSETTAGQAWLRNFHPPDVPAATLLIDALRLLSLRDLQRKLRGLLDAAAETGAILFPALVLPERNLRSFEEQMPETERTNESSAELRGQDASKLVAWRDFHPGAPLRVTPGSDAFVGMVLSEYAPRNNAAISADGRWINPAANLDILRERRCRSIVILTDYIATGAQAQTLATAIARNPTIRSWRSFHLLQIHVATVAGQRSGIKRLEKCRVVDSVHEVETAPSIRSTIKDADAREAIVMLCRTYARKARLALGYGESGGLFVTERRAPNNLPSIFIQAPAGWSPMFPGRRVPQEFVDELGEYRPSETLEISAERVGQLRLGRNERLRSFRQASRDLLQILAIATAGPADVSDVAETMGLDVDRAAAYLATLQAWNFIDPAGRITSDGRSELVANRRGRRWTTAHLEGSQDPYYPVALR